MSQSPNDEIVIKEIDAISSIIAGAHAFYLLIGVRPNSVYLGCNEYRSMRRNAYLLSAMRQNDGGQETVINGMRVIRVFDENHIGYGYEQTGDNDGV